LEKGRRTLQKKQLLSPCERYTKPKKKRKPPDLTRAGKSNDKAQGSIIITVFTILDGGETPLFAAALLGNGIMVKQRLLAMSDAGPPEESRR